MTIISKDEPRIGEALQAAEDAFWASIAATYPEAKSGDLSPYQSIRLIGVMRETLIEWLEFNCDEAVTPKRTTNILQHRIEYTYDNKELELFDVDREHITDQITNGFCEGELIVNSVGTVIRGYWKINNTPDV